MDPTPLADRPTNTHLLFHAKDEKRADDLKANMSSSLEYHRQVLQGKLENGEKDGTTRAENHRNFGITRLIDMFYRNNSSYVSPSDDIMSPCSKKLSDLKGKRFKKYVLPRLTLTSIYRGFWNTMRY